MSSGLTTRLTVLFGCALLLFQVLAFKWHWYQPLRLRRSNAVSSSGYKSLAELEAITSETMAKKPDAAVSTSLAEATYALPCRSVHYGVTARRVREEGPTALMSSHFNTTFRHRSGSLRRFSLRECKCLCSALGECNSFTYNAVRQTCFLKARCVDVTTPLVTKLNATVPVTYYKMACGAAANAPPRRIKNVPAEVEDSSSRPAICPTTRIEPEPRVIWTYWHSQQLPEPVATVVFSWQLLNPNYTVRLLSARTVRCYLPDDDFADVESSALRADLIRLQLLATYGGVWLDATAVLLAPLDDIIPWDQMSVRGGLFAVADVARFSHPGETDFVESWLLAGLAGSYIFGSWSALLTRVVRENGGSGIHISRTNIFEEWTTHAFPTSVSWQEYLVICVAFTYLYRYDERFQGEVRNSSLGRTHQMGYFLQLRLNWQMAQVNAVLAASSHELHRDLEQSKVIKLSTNNFMLFDDCTPGSFLTRWLGIQPNDFGRPRWKFQLVLARYNEDLQWASNYSGGRVIYNKGTQQVPPSQRHPSDEYHWLPNVGRESHSYLTYIVDHYDSLPEYVGFAQGALDPNTSWVRPDYGPAMFEAMLLEAGRRGCSEPHTVDPHEAEGDWSFAFDGSQAQINRERYFSGSARHTTSNFGEFFHYVLGLRADPSESRGSKEVLRFYPAGLMVVSRAHLLSRSVSYYRRVRRTISYENNPLEGHYFERSWFHIFDCGRRRAPEPAAKWKCSAHYRSATACCGFNYSVPRTEQCPRSLPKCVGYVPDKKWGWCVLPEQAELERIERKEVEEIRREVSVFEQRFQALYGREVTPQDLRRPEYARMRGLVERYRHLRHSQTAAGVATT